MKPPVLASALAAALAFGAHDALAVTPVAASPAFAAACPAYYGQGYDADVAAGDAQSFCTCLGRQYAKAGLGTDALDFYARTLSEDLTAFIGDYPKGEAWMEQSFKAEAACKAG